jgi:hypothetical protein
MWYQCGILEDESVRLKGQGGFDQRFDAVMITVPLVVLKSGTLTFNSPFP